jgi:nucleoside triphosphate diphosphatase
MDASGAVRFGGGVVTDIAPLISIMARLRDRETGCPWDVEQTFATIAPYTIEEAYEVADAIERGDSPALKEELGDLLFQVAFHARMAEESGDFAFGDVVDSICAKMIRRHPHVFGDADKPDWEALKAEERGTSDDQSALAGVAFALPALMRAEKLQKRAARTGFDWPDPNGALEKIYEEIDEVKACTSHAELEDEIGDVLFAVVNWARKQGVDPEIALRGTNAKFERRFRAIETAPDFASLPLEDKEVLWVQAKKRV